MRCARCSPRPERAGPGLARWPMSWPRYRKSAHPSAKKALAEIWGAEDKPHALAAVKAFKAAYAAKFPKAAAKITDDAEELLAFSGHPAEHWVYLRTTNPIVGLRDGTAPDQGHQVPGSRAASLAMAFKPRFAATSFRPTLPATLVTRPALQDRLTSDAGQCLTVVVGSAGAGKSVLSGRRRQPARGVFARLSGNCG
jgi:hypothetical protein